MAILDIVSFCLINSQLPIEDTSTPIGRIWGSLLHHILEQHQQGGILGASWGRLSQNPSIIVLFTTWTDKKCRDSFYTAGLGTTAMDCYLQVPITVRYLRNAEIGKILKPDEDMAIVIKTLSSKSSQSRTVDIVNDAWEAYKTSLSSSDNISLLGGELYNLEITEGSNTSDILGKAVVFAYCSRNSSGVNMSEETDYNRSYGLDIHTQIVPLNHSTTLNSPRPASSKLPFPSKISQLFNRDANSFSRSSSPPHHADRPEAVEIEGPYLTWRSPIDSYRLGGFCFSNRVAAPPPSIRYQHMFPHKTTKSYIETVSLTFKVRAPELDDRVTNAGLVWREYRRLALSQKTCLKLHVLSHPATPQRVDLITEWDTSDSFKTFRDSPAVASARAALMPHLVAAASQPRPSPYHPQSEWKCAEVVDFILPASASEADQRAFEYYLWHFEETMNDPPGAGCGQPVYPHREGWIDAHGDSLLAAAAGSSQQLTYRVVYIWDDHDVEAEWVAQFVQTPYKLTGYRAHWVALAVDRVMSEYVLLKRERVGDLRDDVEDENDQDLGF